MSKMSQKEHVFLYDEIFELTLPKFLKHCSKIFGKTVNYAFCCNEKILIKDLRQSLLENVSEKESCIKKKEVKNPKSNLALNSTSRSPVENKHNSIDYEIYLSQQPIFFGQNNNQKNL